MKIEEEVVDEDWRGSAIDEEWRLKRMPLMMEKKRERQRSVDEESKTELWRESCWCWEKNKSVAAVDEKEAMSCRSQRSSKIFSSKIRVNVGCVWLCVAND